MEYQFPRDFPFNIADFDYSPIITFPLKYLRTYFLMKKKNDG